MGPNSAVILLIILFGIGLSLVYLLFRILWTANSKHRRWGQNFAILLLATLLTLIGLEFVFGFLYVPSSGIAPSLSGKKSFDEHWTPLNAHGYRDLSHDETRLRATKNLVVLGDSFAAGHGINEAEDRFVGILARELGPRWSVVLLAKPGWTPDKELEAARSFPHPIDTLILTYVINDIDNASARYVSSMTPMPIFRLPLSDG